jgi:hypothetical protein
MPIGFELQNSAQLVYLHGEISEFVDAHHSLFQ